MSLPVTAKFRKGFASDTCVSFAKTLEEAGADGIAVHGRLREQYYEGRADWDAIAAVKAAVKIPVIANGDIFVPEDARAILEHTRADGLMVARGALGNPFLFPRFKAIWPQVVMRRRGFGKKAQVALHQAELAIRQKGRGNCDEGVS